MKRYLLPLALLAAASCGHSSPTFDEGAVRQVVAYVPAAEDRDWIVDHARKLCTGPLKDLRLYLAVNTLTDNRELIAGCPERMAEARAT